MDGLGGNDEELGAGPQQSHSILLGQLVQVGFTLMDVARSGRIAAGGSLYCLCL
jgi:hypothetical protein